MFLMQSIEMQSISILLSFSIWKLNKHQQLQGYLTYRCRPGAVICRTEMMSVRSFYCIHLDHVAHPL